MSTGGKLSQLMGGPLRNAGGLIAAALVIGLLLGLWITQESPSSRLLVICAPTKSAGTTVNSSWTFDFATEKQLEQFTRNSDTYVQLCGTQKKPE